MTQRIASLKLRAIMDGIVLIGASDSCLRPVDSRPNPTRPFSKPKLTLDIILSDSRLHNTIVFSLDRKW